MVKTVVIDAGHGGHDAGAVGNGLKEKDLTLAIARKTRDYLKGYEGVKVLMTRDSDKFLSLYDRAKFANRNKADLFVSVHINSARSVSANGYESFISPNTKAKSKLSVVHNEIAGYYMGNNIKNRGLKELGFYVLTQTKAPAILTENLFIVNPTEARFIKNNIDKIGKHHAIGIAKFFGLKKKEGNDVKKEIAELKKEINELEKETAALRELVGSGQSGKTLSKYVERGKELGITDGSKAGYPIKREQAIAMIVRMYDKLEK